MSTSAGSDLHWRPVAGDAILRRRAELLTILRDFFAARNVLEVETPLLQDAPNRDHGVVPHRLTDGTWLVSSPEHYLKRLLAAGSGDVWSLGPVCRQGDHGQRHREEFRLLEWYRLRFDDLRLATETVDLCEALCSFGWPREMLTWREAFHRYADLDIATASDEDLRRRGGPEATQDERGPLEDRLYVDLVEPYLGQHRWTILTGYPPERAAQARLRPDADGHPVAARFEIYGGGLELANGYHELADAAELRRRMAAVDIGTGTQDERYLTAIGHGLPDCAGVALGFDRLVMLACGLEDIAQAMAFPDR